jgi:hypothetical protein
VDHTIASLTLQARRSDRSEEFPIMVSIGQPYPQPNGSWACPVELSGLHDRLPHMIGEDSLQSLCLAIGLCGKLLTAFVESGGHLRNEGDDPDSFPLEAYFKI